jgi:hypothetical protein
MAGTRKWTCPSCGLRRANAFCPSCGEEPLRPRDLKVDDLAGRMFNAFSSVDGRLMRSFRALLTRPGSLTQAYVAGRRRAYIGPLQLFLIANALFFALQSWTQFAIFSSTLDSHLHHQDWRELARPLTQAQLEVRHLTLDAFAPIFDRAAVLNAKALIILMALAFVPFLPILFPRPRRPFGAHVLFAVHLYSFVLILMCVALLLAEVDLLLGGGGLEAPAVDIALTLFNLAACAAYLWFAIGAFYGSRGLARIFKVAALTAAIGGLALGYRFTIFLITLYTS